MATNTANVLVGVGVISISPYVTAAGAGTFVDMGHLKTPGSIQITYEDYEVKSERAFGTIKKVPQTAKVMLKVPAMEATGEFWRTATRQPAANLAGTPPNLTLLVGDQAEQYHQLQIVAVGVGTTGVRTFLLWRCIVETLAEIPFAKGGEQMLEMTFDVLYDDSVSTDDKFFKWTDA